MTAAWYLGHDVLLALDATHTFDLPARMAGTSPPPNWRGRRPCPCTAEASHGS